MGRRKHQPTQPKDTKVNAAGMEQIDATVWLIERHFFYPLDLDEQQKAWLRDGLVKLVECCFAFSDNNSPSWRAMYYDLTRQHNGEGLTEEQIEKEAERHKDFLIQQASPTNRAETQI